MKNLFWRLKFTASVIWIFRDHKGNQKKMDGTHLEKPNTDTSMPGMLPLLKLRIGIPSNSFIETHWVLIR